MREYGWQFTEYRQQMTDKRRWNPEHRPQKTDDGLQTTEYRRLIISFCCIRSYLVVLKTKSYPPTSRLRRTRTWNKSKLHKCKCSKPCLAWQIMIFGVYLLIRKCAVLRKTAACWRFVLACWLTGGIIPNLASKINENRPKISETRYCILDARWWGVS